MLKRTGAWPLATLALLGCASLDPSRHVEEAASLTSARTGAPTAWTQPWDEAPPSWAPGQIVSLDEAIARGLRNNRELRAELESIGQANADLVQAGLLTNPVVNFMVMFPSGGGRSMLRGNALPMQPLQDLWLIPARSEVARAELQRAVLNVADRAVETAAAIRRAYAQVQYAQRALELISDSMELVRQSTSVVEIRQTAGLGDQIELGMSQIRHERLRSERLAMEAEWAAARYDLLTLLGCPEFDGDWRVTALDETAFTADPLPHEFKLVQTASEQRLDLRAAEWKSESAARQVTQRQREGWPDFAVGFTLERAPRARSRRLRPGARAFNALRDVTERLQMQPAAAGGEGEMAGGAGGAVAVPMLAEPIESPEPREVNYTLGPMIEVELPIFDWNQAQTARARHEVQQRIAEYEALLNRVVRDVRRACVTAETARRQIELFRREILPRVQQNLALAQQRFSTGQIDLPIYLQAQEDVIDTRLRMLGFVRDYALERAELDRSIGGAPPAGMRTTRPATAEPVRSAASARATAPAARPDAADHGAFELTESRGVK